MISIILIKKMYIFNNLYSNQIEFLIYSIKLKQKLFKLMEIDLTLS
jgi:hypothetical protein